MFSPVSRDPGIAIPGWPGCRVIAKLIFVAFNRRAEISENRASSTNRASRALVIVFNSSLERIKKVKAEENQLVR